MFVVLPFGLATTCYILIRPRTKFWHNYGLRAITYLDGETVSVNGKDAAELASYWVHDRLQKGGFFEHTGKCNGHKCSI